MKGFKWFCHIKDELVILSLSNMLYSHSKVNKLAQDIAERLKEQILPVASHTFARVTLVQHRYRWSNGFCIFFPFLIVADQEFYRDDTYVWFYRI